MNNYLMIKMPEFHPQYDERTEYGYSKEMPKKALLQLLEDTTGGYCMYCYSRVCVDRKRYAHLEHAIEKKHSDELIDCVPNIGLACPMCNLSFKRSDEKKRALASLAIADFENTCECKKMNKACTKPCDSLRKLQISYSHQDSAQIILQPMGIAGMDTKNPLALQYDVLKMEFQPATDTYAYSENEKKFIWQHIARFKLNDPAYRTDQLFYFIKNIIDNDGHVPVYEYNNLIVELFAQTLKNKSRAEILKICKAIYCIEILRM